MKFKPFIESLLETDLYKFSMGQAIYHQFSDYKTTWSFKCRNEEVVFTPEMVEEIKDQINEDIKRLTSKDFYKKKILSLQGINTPNNISL